MYVHCIASAILFHSHANEACLNLNLREKQRERERVGESEHTLSIKRIEDPPRLLIAILHRQLLPHERHKLLQRDPYQKEPRAGEGE